MRIMAIDFGDARIGLAVSDLLGMICGEAWTMEEWNMERASLRIAEEAKKRDVERLVLGLPKNMDGSEGPRAEKSRQFAEMLKADSGLGNLLTDNWKTIWKHPRCQKLRSMTEREAEACPFRKEARHG